MDQAYNSLNNCSFIYNTCINDGGALYLNPKVLLEFDDVWFIHNSVPPSESAELYTHLGGAILIYQYPYSPYSYGTIIKNCYFNNNSAPIAGGCIFVSFGNKEEMRDPMDIPVTIESCIFIKCITERSGCDNSSGVPNWEDQDAYSNGDIIINYCEFKDCTAEYGAIFSHDGTNIGDEKTNITNRIYDHCSSSRDGSCIYSCSYKFVLEHSIFKNNDGRSSTAIVYLNMNEKEINPTIFNCTFSGSNINRRFK